MTEPDVTPPAPPAPPPGAGALLRAAREKQGLHIAALAAALKVPQRKLEALEHDRWDELPDNAFARALAQSVCRALKVDPAPVLALMPQGGAASLEQVSGGLNTPFRDRAGRGIEPLPALLAQRPLAWAGGALLLAALLLWWAPARWWHTETPPAEPAASAPEAFPAAEPEPPASAAPAVDAGAEAASRPAGVAAAVVGAASAPVPAPGLLLVRTTAPSWIEVVDADGRVLLSRTVQSGESLDLDGALPLRVRIGNAGATELRLRGEPVDLAAATRGNIAQLELR
jgi:cytoskeleton protein RodZ